MKHLLWGLVSSGAIAMLAPQSAAAHVSYYDLFNNPTEIGSNGPATTYAGAGVVHGNFGWADAADLDWGDSHHGSWISFDITNPAGALVDISVAGDGINRYFNNDPNDAPLRLGDLTPAFSLYKGVVPELAHDDDTKIQGLLDLSKEGAWRALADTTMANQNGDVATIQYLAHAGEVDGLATSVSLNNFYLAAGSYSLVIGGTCYERAPCGAFNPFEADEVARGYNVNMSVTSVPLPTAAWFMLSGVLGMLGLIKRRGWA